MEETETGVSIETLIRRWRRVTSSLLRHQLTTELVAGNYPPVKSFSVFVAAHGLVCVGQRFLASSQLRDSDCSSGSVLYWSWSKPQVEVRSFTVEPLSRWCLTLTALISLEVVLWGTYTYGRPFDDEQWEEAKRLHEYEHRLMVCRVPVTDIVCSTVGHTAVIVSASGGYTCEVWNLSTKSIRSILFPTIIDAIAVHPGHEMFYAGGRDGKIYNAALSAENSSDGTHGMPINGSLPNYQKAIRCIAFDSKGVLLISGSEDGTIRVWDIKARNIVRELKYSKGPVDNIFVVSSSRTRHCHLH